MSELTLCAVGDIRPNRDDPESLFAYTAPVLRTADITFGQLETTFSERGEAQLMVAPASRPGARVHPRNAAALTYAGFDVVSTASNHSMDWGAEALLDTIELLADQGIASIGAGADITAARRPAVVERGGVKVGFLGYCAVNPPGFIADAANAGNAPMRAATAYEVVDWQPGAPPLVRTTAEPRDVAAMVADIAALRSTVDVVVVSMHWGVHFVPAVVAEYQREVGRAAIDAGADLLLGHHPHILKGVEIHKGRVIFHSLGNFAFDQPYELARKAHVQHLYGYELDPEYPTYGFGPDSRKTMIVRCVIRDGRITRVAVLPALINKRGQAELLGGSDPRAAEVVEYLRWCNRQAGLRGTRFTPDGDEIVIGGEG